MNRRRAMLALILLGYLLLTLAYGAVNPLFEAPDEHWHFFTAVSIADTGRLPRVEDPPDEFLGQEAAQPPLYYLLGAALLAPFDTTGWRAAIWENPYAWIGDASALTNVNRMVHTPAEAWPWQGWALAAHLLRVLSTLFGLGTLLCIYGSARWLWPDSTTRPLLATALVAFLPQFNFIHATVSNDALITLLCSLALYQLVRLWQTHQDLTGLRRPVRSARIILLGITVGLAALSKNAGVLLLLYSLGFLAVMAWRDGRPRRVIADGLLVAGPAVLIAGWLWARNQILYGDWTATAPFIAIAGGDRGFTVWQALGEWRGLVASFVGVFGWFNLRPPQWVYWGWLGIAGLAVGGASICVTVAARKRERRRPNAETTADRRPQTANREDDRRPPTADREEQTNPRSKQPSDGGRPSSVGGHLSAVGGLPPLLAAWPLLVLAGLLVFMLRTEAAQGRLLFPAILPIALGAAWGLAGWSRCAPNALGDFNRRLAPLLALLALSTSIYSLIYVIDPAYRPPLTIRSVPVGTRRVLPELVDRGRGVSLLAAEVDTESAHPGDVIWLTLYWQAGEPPAEPPEFVLEVFGRQMARIANLHSYHGRGLYPASLWPPGEVIVDRFAVRIDPATEAPVLGRVFARIDGGAPGIEVATVKIEPREPPPAPDSWAAELGDHIALVNATIQPAQSPAGQRVQILVRWYVPVGAPRRDYTTLIHLGPPDAPPLSTGDSPPLGGAYPTGAWRNGETIDDRYFLLIPPGLAPGPYPVWIGLYDPITGERLPVAVEGELQPNGVYLAGWVEVICAGENADCAP